MSQSGNSRGQEIKYRLNPFPPSTPQIITRVQCNGRESPIYAKYALDVPNTGTTQETYYLMKNTQFLTPAALSNRWQVAEKTLCNWRVAGDGPIHLRIGGRIRYPLEEVEKYEKKLIQAANSKGDPA